MAKHKVIRPFRLGPKDRLENDGEIVVAEVGDIVDCRSIKDARGEWKTDIINGVEASAGFIRRMITAKKISAQPVEETKGSSSKSSSSSSSS